MKKLLFILFILLTNNMFCLSENEVVKVLREDSLTNHFFNTKNYKYSIQDNKELNESEALIVLSVARNSLYEKYQNYAFLNNIYILNDNSIIFFNESFYINKSDISQTFYNQIKNIQLNNSTSIFADLNFDCKKDLFIFRGDSISFYSIIIDLSDLNNTTILFHSNEIDNHFFKSTEIGKLFGKNISFCIINNKRGFTIPYQIKNKEVITKFYYWSPSEQRYILDESVTQEQIKNAYCPEDFFAYNGLNFSKLDSKLKEGDLKDLDKSQLRVLRNAVYARHGRTFKSVDLQSLWECYTWYKKNPEYTDDLLTETDKYNISLIQKYEMGSVVSAVSGTDFEERINSVDQRNNALQAVSGPDFEERINERHWIRSYFNQVIYCGDRNIIVEYQPEHIKQPYFYDEACSDVIFWYEAPNVFWDHIKCTSLENGIHDSRILIGTEFNYKVNKINSVFYEVQIEDVRISQEMYKYLLQHGHDMKFALDATEPEYSFYFWFNGDYLYIYLEDRTTLYATYCAYDESEIVALQEAIRTNEFDISEFTLPRYADGSWDFTNGKGVNIKKIVGGTYQVKENLQLRETEGTSGEIITTIQADTCMEILSLGKEDTIDGITDNWVKVELLWGGG